MTGRLDLSEEIQSLPGLDLELDRSHLLKKSRGQKFFCGAAGPLFWNLVQCPLGFKATVASLIHGWWRVHVKFQ